MSRLFRGIQKHKHWIIRAEVYRLKSEHILYLGLHCTSMVFKSSLSYFYSFRTLLVLLEQIPYHKLKGGLLSAMTKRVLRLSPTANPVIQIAVSWV